MRKVVLFALLLASVSLGAQPFSDQIGIGLGGIGGYGMEFVDASKTMRSFEGATLDADGYPQRDFQVLVFDMRPCCPWLGSTDDPEKFVPALMHGTYKLSFNGQADIASTGDPVLIQQKQYDAATNTTTASIVVQPNKLLVMLNFTGTRRTAASAINTGVTNIKLLRPGYHNRATDIYRQEYLNAVSHFPVIRFMDFVGTNNSNPDYPAKTEWATRNLPSHALFDGVAPWEYVIALANKTGKDVWLNVPVAASNDYVQQLASLMKNNLHANAKVYIEYSNEVWNGGFDQQAYNKTAAIAEVDAETAGGAETKLNDEAGECDMKDQNLWAGRRYVKRMKEIGDIFVETFSPGSRTSFETRVRPVFAWQIGGWVPYYSCILKWFEYAYGAGSAREHFYGLAGAAYVNAEGAAGNASVEDILETMTENSDEGLGSKREAPSMWWTGGGKIGLKEIADIYGIRMLQYETGPDNGGGSDQNIDNRIAANRAEGMKDVLLHDLGTNWFEEPVGGGLAMYFVLSSAYTRYGSWGATEEVENMHTPKLQALYTLAGIAEDNEGPTFPANVQATMSGSDAVVTWDAATDNVGITHYRISDATGALATVLADEPLTVTLKGFPAANLGQINVVAVDAFNNVSGHNLVTGIEGPMALQRRAYPNPARDYVHIQLARDLQRVDVRMNDVTGRAVWNQAVVPDNNVITVPMTALPSGFYTIRLSAGMRSEVIKVIKQ